MPWFLRYARATFCQLLKIHSIITDEETLKDNNQIWHNHFSFEIIRLMFGMWWPKQVSPFRCWPSSLPGETINFILVALNEERSVKMIALASRNGVENLKIVFIYVLTGLSDYLLLYQILALWWLVLKHPYFVLQPYCPLLIITVAPKFHSGSLLIIVSPSVIHTWTLVNILKKVNLFWNMVVRIL